MNTRIDSEISRCEEFTDILYHRQFLTMSNYNHHAGISCLEHTLAVAELTFWAARQLNLDYISATRGALLHDFYLYDWHVNSPGFHGFKHPNLAKSNAERFFVLNEIEKDVILKHMWPLTIIPPKYRESLLVSFTDKIVTARDYSNVSRARSKIRQNRFMVE